MGEVPDYVIRNRASWDGWAPEYEQTGRLNWTQDEPSWGIWSVPESELHLLPDNLEGLDVIELGCGTGYVSAWLGRRGARPVGIDNSPAQLNTARAFQREFGLEFPLLEGNAGDREHREHAVGEKDQLPAGAQQPRGLGDPAVGVAPDARAVL